MNRAIRFVLLAFALAPGAWPAASSAQPCSGSFTAGPEANCCCGTTCAASNGKCQDAFSCATGQRVAGQNPGTFQFDCAGRSSCQGACDFGCTLNQTRTCNRGVGKCAVTVAQTCVSDSGGGTKWSPPCQPTTPDNREKCANGVDDNCNGVTDEDPGTGAVCCNFCKPPPPRCPMTGGRGKNGSCCEPGTVLAGDPFVVGTGDGLYSLIDAELRPGDRPIRFERHYISSDSSWAEEGLLKVGTAKVATPFGRTSSDTSLRWWHGYYSWVASSAETIAWRDSEGRSKWFNACSTTGCRPHPAPGEHNVEEQLYRTANGFDVVLKDGTRMQYESKDKTHSVWLYFLTRALAPNGVTLYSLTYENPIGCSQAPGSDTGVPYLRRISAPGALGGDIQLTYSSMNGQGGGTECVITSVHVRDSAGNATLAASYAYPSSTAGLISEAQVLGAPTEAYSYSATNMTVAKAGEAAVSHTLSSGIVTAEDNGSQQLGVTRIADAGVSPFACGSESTTLVTISDSDAQQGNASGTASLVQTHRVSADPTQYALPYVYETTDSCTGSSVATRNVCSAGTQRWDWTCGAVTGQGFQSAHKDKRNNWEVWDKRPLPDGGPLLELTKHMRGATDDGGTNALAIDNFTYVYGTSGQQLVKTEVTASGYVGDTNVAKTYAYDATTNRLKSDITSGKTQTFSAGTFSAQQSRFLGTFYFDTRPRSSMSTPDALGRTLEQHGPCWVTGTSDIDCDERFGPYPVTQWEYYPITETGNRANRLKSVKRYPNATTTALGTALETLYEAYDYEGRVTQSKDENLVVTTTTYANGFPNVIVENFGGTNPRTTTHTHENGKLTSTSNPDGTFDVYCYRTSATTSGCTADVSRPWTEKLQWRAKASTATGLTWSDRVLFEYWPDGTVKKETYESKYAGGTTETRKVLQFSADAHRRPTMKKFGDGTGAYSEWSRYDAANNRTAVGNPYNAPPEFCDDGVGGLSKKCAGMEHDRLDRVQALLEYPTDTTSPELRTCFNYDTRGNVVKVKSCQVAAGASCDSNFTTACNDMAADYVFDDFGNLVSATLPNTGDISRGVIKYAYGPTGQLLTKQTQTQADNAQWSEFAHDLLGRGTYAYAKTASTSTTLWIREYDNSTADVTCGAKDNQKGRLAREWNARGMVVYSYNPFGEVTAENRFRTDPSPLPCSLSGIDDKPTTTYTYDSVGRLTEIGYPHDRIVAYVFYLDGERKHQVKEVWVATTSGWIMIADSARWSHGELVAYVIKAPTSLTSAAVEYLNGEAHSSTGFLTRPTTSDKTGRLRSILVSTGSALDTGTGDIFHRTYQWSGEQIAQYESRYLNSSSNVFTKKFDNGSTKGYDQLGRLKNVYSSTALIYGGTRDVPGNTGGYPDKLRSWGYDARGNRNSEMIDNCGISSTFTFHSASHRKDQLTNRTACNTNVSWTYEYDRDGRASAKKSRNDSSGLPAWQVTFGFSPTSTSGGDAAVYKTATVNGATWSYHYDPSGRRILKISPVAELDDEFFYLGAQNQLLEDRGSYSSTSKFGPGGGTGAPIDEYFWLGGKPIAFLRSKYSSTWTRQPDMTGDCQRNGEAMACGLYFIIGDHLGTPALLVDSNRRIAQLFEYDAFGYPNRMQWYDGVLNYGNNVATSITPVGMQTGGNLSVKQRAMFHLVDTEANGPGNSCTALNDYVVVTDNGATELTPRYGGYHSGRKWTDWFQTPPGLVSNLKLVSDGRNCSPGTCWSSTCSPNPTYSGFLQEAWEYRRYENGANLATTPLRFPGQYYDDETDLHENWNRNYDPGGGRYLQPEPMLQQPAVIVATAKQAQSMPAYAYAYNNPLKFTDPTGLYSWIGSCPLGGVAISVEVDRSGTQNADGTWPTEISKGRTNSTVQFRTSEADACRDFELGVQMKQFVPTASLTCWTRLLEQIWEECRRRSPPPEAPEACR